MDKATLIQLLEMKQEHAMIRRELMESDHLTPALKYKLQWFVDTRRQFLDEVVAIVNSQSELRELVQLLNIAYKELDKLEIFLLESS